MPPLTRDTGISVADFTLAIAVQKPGLGLPAAAGRRLGHAAGHARLMVGGALLYTLGLVLLATAQGLTGVVLGAGVAIGAALACNGSALAHGCGIATGAGGPAQRGAGHRLGGRFAGRDAGRAAGQGLAMEFGWRVGVWGFVALRC